MSDAGVGVGPPGTAVTRPPFGSLSARCAASLVDLAVVALLEWPVSHAVHGAGFASQVLVQLLPALYLVLAYTRIGGGQTLGKRLLRLRVVDARGAPLTLAASARRWAVAVGVAWPLWWLRPVGPGLEMPPTIAGWGVIAIVLAVLAIDSWLLLANLPTRRSLHDLTAGSFVVRHDATAPYDAAALQRGQLVACVVLATLAAIAALPAWRVTTALAPRTVELVRVSAVLRSSAAIRRIEAWPTFRLAGSDTLWRVTIYGSFTSRRGPGTASDAIVHAIACLYAERAPRAVGHGEIAAVTLFADDGAVPGGLLILPEDLTPAACSSR
jgi:uncharacterized RDD family membrane protein YckC